MTEYIIEILKISILEMCYLVGLLIIGGLILGILEKQSSKYMQKAFGWNGIMVTSWLGTPIHELGHAMMCLIFRHKITKICLLNRNSINGILGYVEHSYNQKNYYERIGNFFIGLGPIFSGLSALILGLYLTLPNSFKLFDLQLKASVKSSKIDIDLIKNSLKASSALFKSIFTAHNFVNPYFWLFLILAICVSSHMALSKLDMVGAADGLIILFIGIIILNILGRYFNVNTLNFIKSISKYNLYLLNFLILAVMLSLLTLIISRVALFITSFRIHL